MSKSNVVNDTQSAVVEQTEVSAEKGGGAQSVTPTETAARHRAVRDNARFRKMRIENEVLRAKVRELEGLYDIKRQSDIYLDKLVGDKMQRDLDAIRKLDPAVAGLDSIGEEFIKLVENGVDAMTAYHAVKQAAAANAAPARPTTGAVGTAGASIPEFYNSRELDRLTPRDLEDPAVYAKAMRSLRKL